MTIEKRDSLKGRENEKKWENKKILSTCKVTITKIKNILFKDKESLNSEINHEFQIEDYFNTILGYSLLLYSKEDYFKIEELITILVRKLEVTNKIDSRKLILLIWDLIPEETGESWEVLQESLVSYLYRMKETITEKNRLAEENPEIFVKQVLTFSKVEEEIQNRLSLLEQEKVPTSSITVTLDSFTDLDNFIYLEPVLLELTVDLIENSLRYSDSWSEVSCKISQNKKSCIISVSDLGKNLEIESLSSELEEDNLSKIFKDERRLDHPDRVWIWLGATKLLNTLERLHWDIYIKSNGRRGTEITLEVPNKFLWSRIPNVHNL